MSNLEQTIKDSFQQIPFGDDGRNIVDCGVAYSIEIQRGNVHAILVISHEEIELRDKTVSAVRKTLKGIKGVRQITVRTVASEAEAEQESKNGQASMPDSRKYLQTYGNVILVASGKGGVGKSTVSINLALALQKLGKKVSLLDADVYGPSVPIMMGMRHEYPVVINQQVQPLKNYGIDFLSVGSLIDEKDALIWRGPMVHKALEQLLRDTNWPGGDYMIIDLPPGTGDVQLTLAQTTATHGVVMVCTPQDVALLDARRAAGMFERVKIPILGMIENMSAFVCPKCGEETAIFSKGGTEKEGEMMAVPLFGKIPIELDVRLGGDNGVPVVHGAPDTPAAQAFLKAAEELDRQVCPPN